MLSPIVMGGGIDCHITAWLVYSCIYSKSKRRDGYDYPYKLLSVFLVSVMAYQGTILHCGAFVCTSVKPIWKIMAVWFN